jgi:O-antigen/teichoic acid export membrane protein
VAAGRIAAAMIQALTLILLARALLPADFGLFSAVLGIATLAQTLFDLGISTYVVRERARNRHSPFLAPALKANNLLSLLLALISAGCLIALALVGDSRFWEMLPLAVWIASERNADVWLGVIVADGDARVNTANLVLRRLVTIGLFAALWAGGVLPILAFATASAAAAVGSSLFAHVYIARLLAPGTLFSVRQLLRETWPFWLNSVATQARNLDVTIVTLFSGASQAGFYAAASRITGPLRILPTSLATVLLPQASRRNSANLLPLVKLVAGCVGGLALLYLLIALAVPHFVPFALGAAYDGSVPAIQVATTGLAFAAAASLLGALLQGVGLKHFVAQTSIVMTVVCLGGCALGASLSGAYGASWALVLAFVVQSATLLGRVGMFIARKEPNR